MPVPCPSGHSGTDYDFFDGCQTMDDRSRFDWCTYGGDGEFVLQKLSESVPPRIGYKVTHKFPNQALQEPLRILDQYLQEIFGVQ